MKNLVLKTVAAPVLCVALSMLSGIAFANTVTLSLPIQTVPGTALNFTSGALTFAKFDSSLGTLESIQFVISANISSSISLTNQSGATNDFDIYGSAKISLLDMTKEAALRTLTVATPTVSETVTLANNENRVFTENASGGATATYSGQTGARTAYSVTGDATAGTPANSLILADYVGSGTYSLYLSASDYSYAGGPPKTVITSGTASGTVEIVYTYTAAPTPTPTPENVPEPSTWAMVLGGMGLLAFGQRLRRRSI